MPEPGTCRGKCNATVVGSLVPGHHQRHFTDRDFICATTFFLFVLLVHFNVAKAVSRTSIVAAENFYGDVAKQIGGPYVAVTSILNSPDQDPHLFELSPMAARQLSVARIVIYNGIGYDPWIRNLLRSTYRADRKVIIVADLMGKAAGDNPHLWYNPASVAILARALAARLIADDPEHEMVYQRRLTRFQDSLQHLSLEIAGLRRSFAGTSVTATEPVFGYMLEALGFRVMNRPFQRAVMNNTEPAASDVAAFEHSLSARHVKLLIYNRQATGPMVQRMLKLARDSHIPVVAVTETEPSGKDYQAWMASELDAVRQALAK